MRKLRPQGFSIIEVLLSFTILTVAVLGLLGLMPVAAKQQTSSDKQNTALYLCQQKMDNIISSPASAVGRSGTGFTTQIQVGPTVYSITPTVNVDTTKNNCYNCSVDVSWQEQQQSAQGLTRHVALQSLVKQ